MQEHDGDDGNGHEDDAVRLFREAMKDVRRLPPGKGAREAAVPPRPRPAPRRRRLAHEAGHEADAAAPAPAAGRARDAGVTPGGHTSTATPPGGAAGDVDAVERGDVLEYRAPGVRPNVLRGLRRGQFPVEASVDLHGLTAERATRLLEDLLHEARQVRARCVRIVHGKGIGSGSRGPVLKNLVNGWLRTRPEVLAFVSAPPEDGGTGAVYVLLRRHRQEDPP